MEKVFLNNRGQALAEYALIGGMLSLFLVFAGIIISHALEKYMQSIVFLINLPIP